MAVELREKKIVFICGQLGLGGAEKQVYLLLRGLVQRGWEVSVISLNGGKEEFWESQLKEARIEVFTIPANSSKLSRILRISKLLKKKKPLIVHSWAIYANLYAATAGRFAGIPYRIGSERANQHCSRRDMGNFLYSQSLRGIDALVTNSLPAADYLREFCPKLRTFVVPNGIEIPSATSNEQRTHLRREVGISEDALVIGSVGSLVPRKNFELLVNALSHLTNGYANFHLVLIGDGPLREQLYGQMIGILPKGRVHFLGARPNASHLFPLFDIFCFPSDDQEGMPNVLMEAASNGIPTIARNVGSVNEVAEEGKTGFLLDTQEPSVFANRIATLISNVSLRRTMGEAGKKKMSDKFGVERMVVEMENVYKEVSCM